MLSSSTSSQVAVCEPIVKANTNLLLNSEYIVAKKAPAKFVRRKVAPKRRARGKNAVSGDEDSDEDDLPLDDDSDNEPLDDDDSVASAESDTDESVVEDDDVEEQPVRQAAPIPANAYDFWNLISKAQWSDRDAHVRNNFDWTRYWTVAERQYIKQHIDTYLDRLYNMADIENIFMEMDYSNDQQESLCYHIIARGRQTYESILADPGFVYGLLGQENNFQRLFA